ncbi:MAG: trypsin-like peptidase domain-containing protein [Planctomycetaceae bacterium]|nr:trypsin-like peptidase domain-containing protein [Planctomycetaceae bacterium]
MELKSVDNPRRKESGLEGLVGEVAVVEQPRQIVGAASGAADDSKSRAEQHFIVRGKRAKPLRQPGSALETVLGDVDRRKHILETDLSPWRMICALEIEGANGLSFIGTGWFAGPRTVVTAGHCVFDPVEMGGWAQRIRVVPGRDGDIDPPFGSEVSTRFSASDRWQQAQDPDYDYGVIHLSQDLGTKPGHFGLAVLPDAELHERLLNVSGYPITPGGGKDQYFHANRVKAVTARRVFYDIDTVGGQSGSPVWAYLDGSDDPVVIGIHAYGVGGTPAALSVHANSGPRLLPEVLELIQTWI